MAGKGGKLVLGRCTAGHKAATRDENSTKPTLRGCTAHHKSATDVDPCTTDPMEASREDAVLKRKAEEGIYPHTLQEQEAMAILRAANLHKGPYVVSVAASGEATEPKAAVPQALAEGGNKEAVSEHQAEGGINEAVSDPDGYEDESEDGYQDDAEYDDDYDYDEEDEEYDYESQFEEQRPWVKAMLQSFPEAANLKSQELDDPVERVLQQSKPEYENMAARGKIRLLREDIKLAVADDSWFYDDALSAESQDREQFRAKVRKDLIEKGYVEVDEDYYDKKDEYEQQMMKKIQEEWDQKMHFTCSELPTMMTGSAIIQKNVGGTYDAVDGQCNISLCV